MGNRVTSNVMARAVNDWVAFETISNRALWVDAAASMCVGRREGCGGQRFNGPTTTGSSTDHVQGLDIAPSCLPPAGGNVGDDYTSLLPSWLWHKTRRRYHGSSSARRGTPAQSEQGNYSAESVQGWTTGVMNEYRTHEAFEQAVRRRLPDEGWSHVRYASPAS